MKRRHFRIFSKLRVTSRILIVDAEGTEGGIPRKILDAIGFPELESPGDPHWSPRGSSPEPELS